MTKWIHRLLLGSVGLVLTIGCQDKTPRESVPQEPPTDAAVIEETFDDGDTGELSSVSVEPTEAEEEPQGDSQ